jgi:hypothetical protein
MIATTTTAPAVTPWLYSLKVLGGRGVALTLSVADGFVSFAGMRAGGATWLAAFMGALFIAMFQASIALALTSGQPVGARFQQRFFEDTGAIGIIKRCFGVLLIVLGVSFYLWDIGTNYAAFTGGQWLPIDDGGQFTMGTAMLITGYVLMAIAFSLGDELLHVVSDENALGQQSNRVRYQGQRYESQLLSRYQNHYMKNAQPVADELGADHGARWRPRDLP